MGGLDGPGVHAIQGGMNGAGLPPKLIYAYRKTGLRGAPLPIENQRPNEEPGQQTNCDAGVSKIPAI